MKDSLVNLLLWIATNSGMAYDGHSIPTVEQVDRAQLVSMAFGDRYPAAVQGGKYQVSGLYNAELRTIFVIDSISLQSQQGKALLVHELVHFLQLENGLDQGRPILALEPDAYAIEEAYYRTEAGLFLGAK